MGLPVKPDYRMYDFAGGTATVCRIRLPSGRQPREIAPTQVPFASSQ